MGHQQIPTLYPGCLPGARDQAQRTIAIVALLVLQHDGGRRKTSHRDRDISAVKRRPVLGSHDQPSHPSSSHVEYSIYIDPSAGTQSHLGRNAGAGDIVSSVTVQGVCLPRSSPVFHEERIVLVCAVFEQLWDECPVRSYFHSR